MRDINVKISKTSKIILMLTITLCLTIGLSTLAFGEEPTLDCLQKYNLVNTYVISNVKDGDSGNLLNTKATIILGTDVFSPYILDISDFKVSEGTITKDENGVYTLTDIISNIEPSASHFISIERTFTTGTIDYNIDKSTITSDFSGLANYADYLKVDVKVEVNDAAIQVQAKYLTENISNIYDKAFAIFKFVNTSMTYNLDSQYANKGALSALMYKQGVCEDYSQLFVALCRASGIPSRTVSGYRNMNAGTSTTIDLTAERHMWAEIYLPSYGWTIAEPTESFPTGAFVADTVLMNYFGKALTPAEHIVTGYDYNGGTTVSSDYDRTTNSKPTMNTTTTSTLYVVDEATSNAIATATDAVNNAETSKLQIDVDSAEILVSALTISIDRTILSARLDAVQQIIDDLNNSDALTTATNAVIIAETSKLQANVTSAKTLVTDLSDSADKLDLSARLEAVQNDIDASSQAEYRKIIEATRLTILANQTPTRDNYNLALVAVNDLTEGNNKTTLNAILVSILKTIETNEANNDAQIILIAAAKAEVIVAEDSNLQDDVTVAISSIDKIAVNGTEKTDLITRINAVQVIINTNIQNIAIETAKTAIVKAETSNLQSDVNTANSLISKIAGSNEKMDLTTRINTVQATINATINANIQAVAVAIATDAVEKAEGSNLQSDVNTAKSLINKIATGTDKTDLTSRINEVQTFINVNIQTTAITAVINAVIKAEESNLQVDVNIAKSLIGKVAASTDKTDLTNRINAVQAVINANIQTIAMTTAINAVLKAEESKLQIDINTAKSLIGKIQTSNDKTDLTNRINLLQGTINANIKTIAVTIATDAVIKAEESNLQVDVNIAKGLIGKVLTSTEKTNLTNRINAVQAVINANTQTTAIAVSINAVVSAEDSKLQIDVNTAKSLIGKIPTSTEKTDLTTRINAVQAVININIQATAIIAAINAVIIAEDTNLQIDFNTAKSLIGKIATSTDKTDLTNRINIVQGVINTNLQTKEVTIAKESVLKAEGSNLQSDVNTAKALISKMAKGTDKIDLTNRMNAVQVIINENIQTTAMITATASVTKAESSKLQVDVNAAKTLISKIAASADITDLTTRINAVQTIINTNIQTTAMITAKASVAKAEISKLQGDVNTAKSLISKIAVGTDITDLTARINVVQTIINTNIQGIAITTATTSVVKAEGSKLQTDVNAANSLVSKIAPSTDKTNLAARINVVQLIINGNTQDKAIIGATTAVVKAESSKLQVDINAAKSLISKILTTTDKTDLTARINAVQTIINDNIQTAVISIAKTLVVKAENSKLQIDVNTAKSLISKILTITDKADLTTRINAVQTIINSNIQTAAISIANTAVIKAESSNLQVDVNTAKSIINKILTITDKADLTTRINAVQIIINSNIQITSIATATTEVIKAEKSKLQADVNKAKSFINKIATSIYKTELATRINSVQAIINAAVQLESQKLANASKLTLIAYQAPTTDNYDLALIAVNDLKQGINKTTLQAKLVVILKKIKN